MPLGIEINEFFKRNLIYSLEMIYCTGIEKIKSDSYANFHHELIQDLRKIQIKGPITKLISELEEINTFWQLLINIIATMPKHITT